MSEFVFMGYRVRKVEMLPRGGALQINWRVSQNGKLVDSFLTELAATDAIFNGRIGK